MTSNTFSDSLSLCVSADIILPVVDISFMEWFYSHCEYLCYYKVVLSFLGLFHNFSL